MTVRKPVYLDHNSTTPIDPRVLEAMLPFMREDFGNAASKTHIFGQVARIAVEAARDKVASMISAEPKEIIFTSGATESDNIAIKGVMENYSSKGNHLITAATEHKAVLDTVSYLESRGIRTTILDVDRFGQIDLDQLENTITPETVLISLMHANNEIGTVHPVEQIGKIANRHGIIFHSDATQSVGRIPVNIEESGIHLLSLSAHKIYGPKGVGALFVRSRHPRVKPLPVIHGGGHERGIRSGTLNVPGIVGMGVAYDIASTGMAEESDRIKKLRDHFEDGVISSLEGVHLNGHRENRTPNTSNLSFENIDSGKLITSLENNLAVSSGSACTSANPEPSYVLRAIGQSDSLAGASVRFSLGRFTTMEEIDFAIGSVVSAVNELRRKH
ncbi:MAG TPA: IscS subfamily cysteine desulfurase [bacterium]